MGGGGEGNGGEGGGGDAGGGGGKGEGGGEGGGGDRSTGATEPQMTNPSPVVEALEAQENVASGSMSTLAGPTEPLNANTPCESEFTVMVSALASVLKEVAVAYKNCVARTTQDSPLP